MTIPEDLCTRVVELVDGRAEAQVTASAGRSALTRFANSFIHQNVAEDRASVGLTVVVDGRLAGASTTVVDEDGLRRLVDSTLEAAALRPVDPDWPGLAPAGADARRRPLRRGDRGGDAGRPGHGRQDVRRRRWVRPQGRRLLRYQRPRLRLRQHRRSARRGTGDRRHASKASNSSSPAWPRAWPPPPACGSPTSTARAAGRTRRDDRAGRGRSRRPRSRRLRGRPPARVRRHDARVPRLRQLQRQGLPRGRVVHPVGRGAVRRGGRTSGTTSPTRARSAIGYDAEGTPKRARRPRSRRRVGRARARPAHGAQSRYRVDRPRGARR